MKLPMTPETKETLHYTAAMTLGMICAVLVPLGVFGSRWDLAAVGVVTYIVALGLVYRAQRNYKSGDKPGPKVEK